MGIKTAYGCFIWTISILDICSLFNYITLPNLGLILSIIFLIDIVYALTLHKKFSMHLVLDILLLFTILCDFGFLRLIKQFKHVKVMKKMYPLINKGINTYKCYIGLRKKDD
ncbi:MAG: hypothetical protein LBC39_02585 [Methanobrevibacter sp.]|jgi:hypothetical protein|nr:hypothetical protein [Candidatus Methanovirga aequatorialis]